MVHRPSSIMVFGCGYAALCLCGESIYVIDQNLFKDLNCFMEG